MILDSLKIDLSITLS